MNVKEKAIKLVKKHHDGQMYGDRPYIEHCLDVAAIVKHYYPGEEIPYIAAFLHDILEDTNCTFKEIEKAFKDHRDDNGRLVPFFGFQVASVVSAVTDEEGKNRKERKAKTYPKMYGFTNAKLVKLADRISNVRESKKNNRDLFRMYRKEHLEFKRHLHVPDQLTDMWEELDRLLDWSPFK